MNSLKFSPTLFLRPAVEGILFGLTCLIVTNAAIYFIYLRSAQAVKAEIKDGLLRNVSVAALQLDGDQHRRFTSKAFRQDPAYQHFIEQMEMMRKASINVRYLYTCIMKDGRIYFIANGSPQNDNNKDGIADEAPQLMDPYPDAGNALVESLLLKKPTVDIEPYTDAWGTFYSAYAPISDSNGSIVGTLGMDLELKTLQARLDPIGVAAQRAAFTSGILSVLFGTAVWFFRSNIRKLQLLHHHSKDQLNSVEKERHQLRTAAAAQLAAVAATLQSTEPPADLSEVSDATRGYAAALNQYAFYRLGKRLKDLQNFDPTHFLLSILPEGISLQVSRDVPPMVFGDQDELSRILQFLCFHPYMSNAFGSLLKVCLSVANEQLHSLELLVDLHFGGTESSITYNSVLVYDADHPDHMSDEVSLKFATCCEQVRALRGVLLHSNLGVEGEKLVIALPFDKSRET
jgi:hypothetical protein